MKHRSHWDDPGSIVMTMNGAEGRDLLSIVPHNGLWKFWQAKRVEKDKPKLVHWTPVHTDPSGISEILASEEKLCCKDCDFASAHIKGLDGLWADLLLLAWGWRGTPSSALTATSLLSLDENHLGRLRGRYQRLATNDLDARVRRIMSRAGAQGLGWKSLAELLRLGSPSDDADLESLERFLDDLQHSGSDDYEVRLAPFRLKIASQVDAWLIARARGSSLWATARLKQQARRLRLFMEEYVEQHGVLPAGKHELLLGSRGRAMEVDFDSLNVPPNLD